MSSVGHYLESCVIAHKVKLPTHKAIIVNTHQKGNYYVFHSLYIIDNSFKICTQHSETATNYGVTTSLPSSAVMARTLAKQM